MPISTTLVDTEGFDWDLNTDNGALGVLDGQNDTFDGGMELRVNGVRINPGNASLDLGARELNAQPVLVGGIGVQRSILVSDASISATGFARFLDSFTNTTNATVTFTVQTVTNSGADSNLITPFTSSGDTVLAGNDVGFTTSDGGVGDTRAMIAYGTAGSLNSLPDAVTRSGTFNDTITVTHTITLAPGETRSLLQFATQSNADADAAADLTAFTGNAQSLSDQGFLAGLSRAEQLSIVNYAGFDALQAPFSVTDGAGNQWGIDRLGSLSTLDDATLTSAEISLLRQHFTTILSATASADGHGFDLATTSDSLPGAVVTYHYLASATDGFIRLYIDIDLTELGSGINFQTQLGLVTSYGANPALLPAQHAGDGSESAPGVVSGVLIDDSESGSGGTLAALTAVFGTRGAGQMVGLFGTDLSVSSPDAFAAPGGTHTGLLYFFALDDTGIGGLLHLERLTNPGPEALAGLSDADLASLINWTLDQQDRLQEVLGADNVDDVIIGHTWGDSILGGSGDDEISAGGSDDLVFGGVGEDQIDGGDGADSLFGGGNNDDITGGTGNDSIQGDDGDDYLAGQAGDDELIGGLGRDTLVGASGADLILGNDDNDRLSGNTGNDSLYGDAGDDQIFGGGQDDLMFGGGGLDRLLGGAGNDTLNGDDDNDVLDGGDGADSLYGGNGSDTLSGGDASHSGVNRLFGGQDGDRYNVTSARDRVTEIANGLGTDVVFSTISYTLTDHVENLVLQGTALNGTGNGLANRLVGNNSANLLDGLAGADTMVGGFGNDIYVVTDAGDTVAELDGLIQGSDTVRSFLTYTLTDNVEILALQGTAAINGTGNAAANTITGNSAVNTLNGGLGNDTLGGGLGADVFVFNTALGSDNVDHITDFVLRVDLIHLDDAIFTGLALGRPFAGSFTNGTAALDANDRLIYDINTGTLRYDADGNLGGAAVVVAIFDNNVALAHTNFLVI